MILGALWTGSSYHHGAGADSPGQAVERLLRAIERGDAVGAAQMVLPAEGRLLAGEGELAIRQLSRFSAEDASLAPNTTGASKVLRWSIESVSSPFMRVEGEQATVNVLVPDYPRNNPNVDPLTQGLNETRAGTWTRHFLSASGRGTDRSLVLGAVRSGGRWYVSVASTSAQAWNRLAARKPKAQFLGTGGPAKMQWAPVGASSAEQAVQGWLDALVDLDYRTVRTLTNPIEAEAFPIEAIQTIWGVRIEKLRRQFELTVADSTRPVQKRTTRFGSSTLVPVTIEDAKFALTEPGAEPFVSQYHQGCLVILSAGKATKHCGRQIPRFGEQFSIPVSKPTIDRFVGRLDALAAARQALPGLVAVQHNGAWFVSPTQSLLLNLGEGLAKAKRADIQALVVDVENAISSDE
jgi:hypothetical protein